MKQQVLVDGSDDILADGSDEDPGLDGLGGQDLATVDGPGLLMASEVIQCGVANPQLLDIVGGVLIV